MNPAVNAAILSSDATSIGALFRSGGWIMFPLLLCSLLIWGVIFERIWVYRKLGRELLAFHQEALAILYRRDLNALSSLCARFPLLPTSKLVRLALERMSSQDPRVRAHWQEAVERQRQLTNQELKQGFWILGTIAAASPFIGLFGTVVGVLRSFNDIARTGSGGFAVVASGISEALIATAAGIGVAVISVLAFNAFQTRWSAIALTIRLQLEEIFEVLPEPVPPPAASGDESKLGDRTGSTSAPQNGPR